MKKLFLGFDIGERSLLCALRQGAGPRSLECVGVECNGGRSGDMTGGPHSGSMGGAVFWAAKPVPGAPYPSKERSAKGPCRTPQQVVAQGTKDHLITHFSLSSSQAATAPPQGLPLRSKPTTADNRFSTHTFQHDNT